MSRHPVLRLFLVFALMLNGMLTAQAAVQHALGALPVIAVAVTETGHCHEAGMDMAGMDLAQDAASLDHTAMDHNGMDHKGTACCQGGSCDCTCVMPLPMPTLDAFSSVQWQPVQSLLSASRYTSVAALRTLRPPIA